MHLGSFLHRSQAIVTSQQKSTGFRTFTSSGQPSSRQYFLGSFGGNGSISVPWRPAISFAICVLRFKVHSTASSKRGYLDAPARSLQLKRGLNNKQLCQNCQNCQTTKAKKSNSEILPQTENLIMGFIRQNAAAGLKTVRNSPSIPIHLSNLSQDQREDSLRRGELCSRLFSNVLHRACFETRSRRDFEKREKPDLRQKWMEI